MVTAGGGQSMSPTSETGRRTRRFVRRRSIPEDTAQTERPPRGGLSEYRNVVDDQATIETALRDFR
jgi:hypothetical protein